MWVKKAEIHEASSGQEQELNIRNCINSWFGIMGL
jgi:hypothetical protein